MNATFFPESLCRSLFAGLAVMLIGAIANGQAPPSSPAEEISAQQPHDAGEWFRELMATVDRNHERLSTKLDAENRHKLLARLTQGTADAFPNADPDELIEALSLLKSIYSDARGRSSATIGERAARALRCRGSAKEAMKSIDSVAKLGGSYPQLQNYVELDQIGRKLRFYNYEALERSIRYLAEAYEDEYPNAKPYLSQLDRLRQRVPDPAKLNAFEQPDLARELVLLRHQALVGDNPAFDFDEILVVKRRAPTLGERFSPNNDRPPNWAPLTSLSAGKRHRSTISTVPIRAVESQGEREIFAADRWIGRVDLHFDGQRLLFSSPELSDPRTKRRRTNWNLYEMAVDGGEFNCLTAHLPIDVDSYDACYLADDRVIFGNTSGYQGVPCVGGADWVANLHVLDPQSQHVRRLTFEQDSDWHPTMLPNGRVLYLRWEYTDSAHYFSRVLMHMNPDGTDQREFYGSNSYWPNSLFYAKPLPDSSTEFVGIVSGHHGVKRSGELTLFDVSRGRTETEGAVQRMPGYGQPVKNITKDHLVDSWPYKMINPQPLDDTYFLAALSEGGIVLVDRFDNIVPITASSSHAYYEPIPLRPRQRPPVIPDRVRLEESTAIVQISDIYHGRGLPGIPTDSVKALRVFRYEYAPRNRGGHYDVGMEAGWDVRVLLGEVPVNADGSTMFEVPANTALALQPLDEEGAALTHMRSWFTAMPGEVVSCIGCHEDQNDAPPPRRTLAFSKAPDELRDFYGPPRAFSFDREVQPVLDKFCIGCHDGADSRLPNFADTSPAATKMGGGATKAYWALHPYVRRNGPEGNYRTLTPLEFHIDTSELVQILKKGHYGVDLSDEAWRRLITWIDLNVPYRGHWNDPRMKRRFELRKEFIGDSFVYDFESEMARFQYERQEKFVEPGPVNEFDRIQVAGFPVQVSSGPVESIDLGDDVRLEVVPISAGRFAMGSANETPDEGPMTDVAIEQPFLMGKTEVTLRQYLQFDSEHRNGFYDMHYKDQVKPGYDMDANLDYPVIRVSWEQAMAFCEWLSEKSGRTVTLPTEAQWEWAARAGTDTPLYYGRETEDFGRFANLADANIAKLAVHGVDPQPIANPDKFWDFVPKIANVNDGRLHLAPVAGYEPNRFGLHDMVGNVSEWTRSAYRSYPYLEDDGRNDVNVQNVRRVVRGGSWRDRPIRATSSWRWAYPQWQRVYNTGFRVVVLP